MPAVKSIERLDLKQMSFLDGHQLGRAGIDREVDSDYSKMLAKAGKIVQPLDLTIQLFRTGRPGAGVGVGISLQRKTEGRTERSKLLGIELLAK